MYLSHLDFIARGAQELQIRTLGFSPDGTLVSIWSRQPDGSKPEDINLLAAPTAGGPLRPYLNQAAEYDWSTDGRIVYHSTAPGDPTYIRDPHEHEARHLYTAPPGVHCHFPIFAPDGALIYLVCGQPPDKWDIWRIAAAGGAPERLTELNTRVSHPVFLDPTLWPTLPPTKKAWVHGSMPSTCGGVRATV